MVEYPYSTFFAEEPMFARLIRWIVLLAGHVFYPRVALIGTLPHGAALLAANHPNGLLDGLALILAINQLASPPIAFLAKSTFFANPLIAVVLRAFGAVPIYRPTDIGRRGGPETAHPQANGETFAAARAVLHRQGRLAIFPEGTPNPQAQLLPLKTGTARIALETEVEAHWSLALQLIPIGLWFEDQAQPRTGVVVVVGTPINIADFRAAYTENPQDTVRALTEQLQTELTTVVAAAALAGRQRIEQPKLWAPASHSWRFIVAVAPFALVGYLLALPGMAFSPIIHWLLTRRHRANLGTSHLVALAIGFICGWLLVGVVAGWYMGVPIGLFVFVAGPLLGIVALHWGDQVHAG